MYLYFYFVYLSVLSRFISYIYILCGKSFLKLFLYYVKDFKFHYREYSSLVNFNADHYHLFSNNYKRSTSVIFMYYSIHRLKTVTPNFL